MDECLIRKGMISTAVIAACFVIQIDRQEAELRFLQPRGIMDHV